MLICTSSKVYAKLAKMPACLKTLISLDRCFVHDFRGQPVHLDPYHVRIVLTPGYALRRLWKLVAINLKERDHA